ncbi:hypothetical protein TNCV_1826931 [Trichonephila clavipes]|nr:hypothetical protein TNCV_1826931 [Trichonephila clavipes]
MVSDDTLSIVKISRQNSPCRVLISLIMRKSSDENTVSCRCRGQQIVGSSDHDSTQIISESGKSQFMAKGMKIAADLISEIVQRWESRS